MTLPRLPKTLPNRTAQNRVALLVARSWTISSAARLVAPITLAGETALNGKFPINTSGGLKSKGHPVGATGVAQMIELYKQLTGQAEGGRQLKSSPKVGMAQNMGGTGASSVVHIMEVA